jgi:hypothetical protein
MKRFYLLDGHDLQALKTAILDRSWLRPMVESQIAEARCSLDSTGLLTDTLVTNLERRIAYEFEQWKRRGD